MVGLGGLIGLDQIGIENHGEKIKPVGHIEMTLFKRNVWQILERWAVELLQELFSVQGLQHHGIALEQVRGEAARMRLGHCTLDHFLTTGAPNGHLDVVFFLECINQCGRILGALRRVEIEDALLFCFTHQTSIPIGALVHQEARH